LILIKLLRKKKGRLTLAQAHELSGLSEDDIRPLLAQQGSADELISVFHLEIGTPLAAIAGYSELLLAGLARYGTLNPTQAEIVEHIRQENNKVSQLINLFLPALRKRV
jgi:signal transduction histidine kinase